MINSTRGAGRQVAVNQSAASAEVSPPPGDAQTGAAESVFRRMTGLCPEVESAIPPRCTTASAKALYVMTHRLLSKQLKGAAMTLSLGQGSSMSLTPSGGLELTTAAGQAPVRLNNANGDLGRLLDGAEAAAPGQPSPYVTAATSGVEVMLSKAVGAYYANSSFDGGGAPKNARGQNTFAYATMQQVLVSEDPSQRGFECLASADFHLYKSMGLIPPELSRSEVERRYTSIHGDASQQTPRLGHSFDLALRGIPSPNGFGPRQAAQFANALRADDWAKLTGASTGTYTYQALPNISAVSQHLAQGGAAVHAGWADHGHHFVVSAVSDGQGQLTVNQDDSLRDAAQPRPGGGQWPNRVPYDPTVHTQFWAIKR